MKTLLVFVASVVASLSLGAQPLPPQSTLNTYISSACQEALGVDCMTDPQQSSTFDNILAAIQQRKIAPSQSAIVQQYLIPQLQKNPGMQAGVVDRAYKALGKTAGSSEESLWMGKYSSWQTYQRLVPLVKQAPAQGLSPVPGGAGILPQSNQPQVQAAFQKLLLRAATAGELQQLSQAPPSLAEGSVRSYLAGLPAAARLNEIARFAPIVFQQTMSRSPQAAEMTTIQGQYKINWSAADDLATYLRNNAASFRAPVNTAPANANTRPPSATSPSTPAPTAGSLQSPTRPGTLAPPPGGGGQLTPPTATQPSANGVVAQGAGNVLGNSGAGVVAQGAGNVVGNSSASVVAQGAGNVLGNSAAGVVAQGAGNFASRSATEYRGSATSAYSASTPQTAATAAKPAASTAVSTAAADQNCMVYFGRSCAQAGVAPATAASTTTLASVAAGQRSTIATNAFRDAMGRAPSSAELTTLLNNRSWTTYQQCKPLAQSAAARR